MEKTIKVRVFLGDREIKREEYPQIQIKSAFVDRIVNDVCDRAKNSEKKREAGRKIS